MWVGGWGWWRGGRERRGRGEDVQRLEQQRAKSTFTQRRSCLPLAKRFGQGRSPPPLRPHSSPRTATCIPSSFLRARCPTTLQVSDERKLYSPCVCCPETLDEKPLWPARSAREAFCPTSHKVKVPIVHKLDQQLLSGEADSEEVHFFSPWAVRPKMTSCCPRSSKLASLGEGCTRTTAEVLVAADEARASPRFS